MSKKNQTYTYAGVAKWAMLFKPDEKYDVYKITLYPDKTSLKAYVKNGHQGVIKEDEDGKHVTFRRKVSLLTKKKEVWELGPPKVVDAEGNKFTELVGNGSEVEVVVEVYDTVKGLGTRLNEVRVLNHVPYTPADGD